MSCGEFERTSAYLDGELGTVASAAAEHHIADCRHCQALIAAAGDASEALRSDAAYLRAPASLRAKIARRLDAEAGRLSRLSAAHRPAANPPRRQFWFGAASGVGASAIAAAIALAVVVLPASESLTSALVDDHVQALSSGRVIGVASSNHHTVKPWFAGRVPLSPPVNDFAAEGFRLTGGRVGSVEGGKAAVVVYRHGPHEIDLYVWPSLSVGPPPTAERRGYHVVAWRNRDLTLAAVSDVQPGELDRFVRLVKAAGE